MEHQARRHIAKVFGNKRQGSVSLPGFPPKSTEKPTSSTQPAAPPPTHTTTPAAPPPPKTTTTRATPTSTSTTSTSTSSTSSSTTSSSSSSTSTSSSISTVSTTPTGIAYNTTPGLTNPNQFATATPTPSNDPSGNSSNSGASGGTIAGVVIGALFGVAALILIFGFVRRRIRKSSRDRWNRDSFIRDSMMLPPDATRPDSPPVIGTRNALALARQNMASEDSRSQYNNNDYGYGNPAQPEMSFTPGSHLPAHYGGTQGAAGGYYDGYDAYGNPVHDQPAQAAPGGYYDMYGAPAQNQHPQHGHTQYDDLARAVEVPAVALHSPTTDGGRNSPPGGRQLNANYGSYRDVRSGTPTEANPQQAYLAPGDKHITQSRDSVYSANDAYGGM